MREDPELDNWYGWFLIIPLLLICAGMAYYMNVYIVFSKKNENTLLYTCFRSLQLVFGYAGGIANVVVGILLLFFLIPLGLNLAAVINSSNEVDGDPFDVFPVDPFPSSTICFTNFTILDQEERWENRTTTFSNSCNKTFETVPCEDVRDTIITKLAMIGIMSAGQFVMLSVVWCVAAVQFVWYEMCLFLSSSGPNVKVKSKLGPEIGFVMGWPTTTTTR